MDPVQLVDGVIDVAAHLDSELEEALAEHRLTRPSYLVLDALHGAEGHRLNQRELVARVRRTAGTMSIRLRRLERAHLIEREVDPANRRSVTVTLTERGERWHAAAAPAYVQRAERLVGGLPDGAAAALAEPVAAWHTFFEPDERDAPRLGVAVAAAAVAKRMRSAVGLPDVPGVLVVRVKRDSPGGRAGLSRGDLVTGAGGEPVRSLGDLERAVRGADAGVPLALSVLRGAEPHELEVTFEP
jgi:DNA-binding MarR family transcriptional regulator